jgi:hypothetical protein
MTDTEQAIEIIQQHRAEVKSIINRLTVMAEHRGDIHDQSKLLPPEADTFTKHVTSLAKIEFGSSEYNTHLEEMGCAIKHHYAVNRHHPEHHDQGIKDFNIIDLLEFCADIRSASRQQNGGNVLKSLGILQARFGYSDDLASIIKNTMVLLEL